MPKFLMSLIALFALASYTPAAHANPEPDPETQVNVRLLTHFHKSFGDGWGVGGWLIMPIIVPNGSAPQLTPLFLIGPRYNGKGFWVEAMAGGLVAPDPAANNYPSLNYNKTKTVQSTRFQFTPKAIESPINIFGNLQFIDIGGEHPVTEQSTMVAYTFLMVDYVLPGKKALIGIETENYFGKVGSELDGDEFKTFNDIAIGPQVVFPFDGLNILLSYQKHVNEDIDDQIWIRAMHNFGGPKAKKK